MMSAAACLDPNNARRERREEPRHLEATKPLSQHRLPGTIDTVNLKDMFRQVETDDRGGHGGDSLS